MSIKLAEILKDELIFHQIEVPNSKKLLQYAAHQFATCYADFDAEQLFINLHTRERLGSTGIGNGVAIPHCVTAWHSDEPITTLCAFFSLKKKIPFAAIDGEPVDLVFVLLALGKKQQCHLDALAAISRKVMDEDTRKALRNAKNQQQLATLLKHD